MRSLCPAGVNPSLPTHKLGADLPRYRQMIRRSHFRRNALIFHPKKMTPFERPGYPSSMYPENPGDNTKEDGNLEGRESSSGAYDFDIEDSLIADPRSVIAAEGDNYTGEGIDDSYDYRSPAEKELDFEIDLIEEAAEECIRLEKESEGKFSKAALVHSDWVKKARRYISLCLQEGDPDKIESFWYDFDKKIKDSIDPLDQAGRSVQRYLEEFKYEVMSCAAVQGLLKELKEDINRKKGSPKAHYDIQAPQDTDIEENDIDFWIKMQDDENIPCHFISIDISEKLDDRMKNRDRGQFIIDHYTNFRCPDKKLMGASHLKKADQEEIKAFFDSNPEGMLIMVPKFYGKFLAENKREFNKDFKENFISTTMKNKAFRKRFNL